MKLQLKQLAPYLPYGLKWTSPFGGTDRMTGIITDNVVMDSDGTEINDSIDLNYIKEPRCKPILKPLSDLFKRKRINDLRELSNNDMLLFGLNGFEGDLTNVESYKNDLNFTVLEYLYKNHFDVFGLIEKGLAIDINTQP